MDLREEVRKLLQKIGPGQMMNTAYDTAWIARLGEIGEPIGELALEWLRENQLPDGSWGAEEPLYYHDRVICTLAAMNALARRGRVQDRKRLRRAEAALNQFIGKLQDDPAGETIGFELIVPTLLREAQTLGAIHQQEFKILKDLAPMRSAKLAALPKGLINREVTLAFSAEMAGTDNIHLLDVENLQEPDGSISYSPSATAYFARYVRHNDEKALQYLHKIAPDGIAPNVYPFDVFEQAWVLWNLSLSNIIDENLLPTCIPHLEFLKDSWIPGKGSGFAANYAPKDGDETSLVYDVLKRFNQPVDIEAVLHFEHVYYFRCFDLESNPSISANIHVLGALSQAGFSKDDPRVQKILLFLQKTRIDGAYWFDKWHASPYYATSHAIISSIEYNKEWITRAVDWIISTQRQDGSWGYYTVSTAEETSYSLQALINWKLHGGDIPIDNLNKGKAWLKENSNLPYPPLWIGKCLYCPELVVRSTVLSALILASQEQL